LDNYAVKIGRAKRKAPAGKSAGARLLFPTFVDRKPPEQFFVNLISKNVNLIRKYTVNDISKRRKNCQPF
jgi:hypothetical protein